MIPRACPKRCGFFDSGDFHRLVAPTPRKMKPKISIGSCHRAIWIAGGGIPLMIRGEQVLITRNLRTQGKHWVCGDIRLPRASQEELTRKSRAIMKRQTALSFLLPRQRYPSGSASRRLRLSAPFPSHFGVSRCASPRSQPGISAVGSAETSGLRPKRRNSSPSGRVPSLRTRTRPPNSGALSPAGP